MYPPVKMSHIPKNKKKALNPLSKIMMMIKKHLQLMFKLKLSLMINFEPLKVHEALVDPDWVIAMQEELECFTRNEVCSLVERPKDHRINVIGTKWVFKNKQDEDGIVIRNKARKFEMSMMGELKFFLGFQVRQLAKGTFISQEKYVKDMLKKFNMTNASPMKTPMPVKGQLGSCDGEKDVDIKEVGAMCKNTNDVAHQSLSLNQETRRRQNEFMATRNAPVPPPGPELEPVHAPNWEMPLLSDEMFQNFDPSLYFGGPPPRPARAPTADDEEDEGDEDDIGEDDDDEADDEDGDGSSPSTGHEFY
ncbi:hypothetical protein QYE76_050828 [Lolium multiflorum]|uniref:Reverse transcriptase Ty1/copia-type domain-containing protein n=1 Tax=Lolium multiflorum TaxID=4521 RepID=A0AAD8SS15_LOLMU|nr:hypothetical protein QYE76_050828 [Lolium multiflorum]